MLAKYRVQTSRCGRKKRNAESTPVSQRSEIFFEPPPNPQITSSRLSHTFLSLEMFKHPHSNTTFPDLSLSLSLSNHIYWIKEEEKKETLLIFLSFPILQSASALFSFVGFLESVCVLGPRKRSMATINGYTETAQGYQANGNNTRVNAAASPPKQPHPPAKNVDSQSVLKRLMWVFQDLDFFFIFVCFLFATVSMMVEDCYDKVDAFLLFFCFSYGSLSS
jgi:hypothetical protein